MAPRKKSKQIDKTIIVSAFAEMAKDKNIDKDLLQGIMVETLSLLVKKKFGNHANFEIVVNMEKGDIEVYLIKEIVETEEQIEDVVTQISLEEAQRYSDEDLGVGEDFIEEITLDNIAENFGRRLVAFASQTMNQKIRDIERDNLFNEFKNRVGEVITGEVHQIKRNNIVVSYNRMEMRLPRVEQIPNEMFRTKKNSFIRAMIKEVRQSSSVMPDIILTRNSNAFLAKLLEIEVPEIYDGLIVVKSIARDPGERAKVAIYSLDDKIDAIGACVGIKGVRINSIMRELNNENIDLIKYSEDPIEFIVNSLAPAKIKEISISRDTKTATVIVPEEMVPIAIGKNGQNVRLASEITGYDIKLMKEGGEDIEIQEFERELGTEILDELLNIDIHTAREFLDAAPEVLLRIPNLTASSILEFRRIMLTEFEEEENSYYIEELRKATEHIIASEYIENTENTKETE